MVKRFLFLMIGVFAFAGLKAQISYTGSLPLTEETEGCEPPEPLSSDEAFEYLTQYLEFESPEDCNLFYSVECSISDVVTTEECYFTVIRSFLVVDACGSEQEFHQMIFVYYNLDDFAGESLPENTFDAFSIEEALPNTTASVDAYLAHYGVEYPWCWGDHESSYTALAVGEDDDCSVWYDLYFQINPVGCPQQLLLNQRVILAPSGLVQCSGTVMTPYEATGCDETESIVKIRNIGVFSSYGVDFSDYLHEDIFEITCTDELDEESPCNDIVINRTYTVYYPCTDQEFTLYQELHIQPFFMVTGTLEPLFYTNEPPQPYTYAELDDKLDIHYSCGKEYIDYSYEDVPDEDNENLIERKYNIMPDCSYLDQSVSQYLFRMETEPKEFMLNKVEDVSMEGVGDGYAELKRPSCFYCPSCPDEEQKIFKVEWYNNSTGEMWTTNPDDPECDIYSIHTLTAGNYEVKVFPICPDFSWDDTPIFKDEFKIGERKMEVNIADDMGLISNHVYRSFMAVISLKGADGNYVMYENYDNLVGKFNDEWELTDGLLYSPKKKEWDLFEMHNPHMNGQGAYENIKWRYDTYNEQYSHGLQRFIVAKDEHNLITYRMYLRDQRNNELGTLYKVATKTLYHGELCFSDDPNEIFGPVGYTNADSTCVRMINSTDDVDYTIMFENDPEFATAAAARVKVECPLSDKIDPTTFRLGNFGFNNMTFEVPELASYYNQRIQLDSLGYWLDVTASIQVPENIAYWIFQTIDPATGVAPIDSLGFLPVNDTLTGCGEGYVSFTAALAGNGMRSLHTGDEVLENAQIYFDENDVVPTNDYINQLDVVAPTSVIVCDTLGAFAARKLNIAFSATDDMNGSGVRYVELYANIDQTGFELLANVHPDSVFVFPMNNGTNFEFIGLAVDNVGNKENYKTYPELYYALGNPPTSLMLSKDNFKENDVVGTLVGSFKTIDDQISDVFAYILVDGEGSADNSLFRIEGNKLLTNYDFRCHGFYDYNIRVRSTDLSGLYIERNFAIRASRTEEVDPVTVYESICPGESIIFGNERITAGGVYEHTFSNYLGCDSLVYMTVSMNEVAPTAYYEGDICRNYAYDEYGFDLSAETIAALTQGWSMASDTTIIVDNYKDNAFGCTDTLRLALTVKPAFDVEDNHLVCPSDLPYVYKNRPYVSDTTVLFSYTNRFGCDSIVRFNLTLNPDYGTQSDALANGWYWYSTYIDQSNGKGLKNLEDALGRKGNLIKSKMNFVQYYPEHNQWYGNLDAINNENMFMINTTADVTADVTGCYALACPITIRQGWNWIGYPCVHTNSVASAMSGLARTPQDGDVLKSKSAFATYYGAYDMWYGSLGMLNPGEGYMYMSNDDAENTLIYPSVTRDQGTPVVMQETFWQADGHQFARNITFVGAIELDGNIIESDTLEVGVFCHGEQRGSGRAIYLDKLGEYRLFLTVHGEEGDELNFRLYDHEKNKERRIRSRQQVVFHDDDSYGKIDNPYLFVFNTDYDKLIEAEICDGQYYVENGFRAYRSGTYFNELPNDSIIRLDLTVNPVYHEEKSVVAFEFPFHYDDMTFDAPGTYNLQYNTAEECDSTLVLTVQPYDGVRELLISPVPAERTQRVTLFFPFTADEQHDLLVEVFTLGGNLMQSDKPKRFPIELDPFATAGTYMVKITMGTGEVVTGKIIVK